MSLKKFVTGRNFSYALALVSLLALEACHHNRDSEEKLYDELYAGDGKGTTMPAPGSVGEFVLIAGDRVHYGFDKYNITCEYEDVIVNQASFLKTYTDKKATIAGHCDKRGTREYNLALGMRRANAHKNALVAQGIDPSRLKTISYGKERPLVEGDTEAAYAKNRATVVHLD